MRRISTQLKLGFRDIWKQKKLYFVLNIQILVVMFIQQYAGVFYSPWSEFKKELEVISMVQDTTWYLINNDVYYVPEGNQEIEKNIYERTGGKCFFFDDSSIMLEDFVDHGDSFSYSDPQNKLREYQTLFITDYFSEFFSWSVSDGRLFTASEYENMLTEDGYIPILMGNDYAAEITLNQIIDNQYQVIGFLSPHTFYLNPKWSGNAIWLDQYIVIPMGYIVEQWDGVFFNNLYINADRKTKDAIQDELQQLHPDYNFRSMKEQIAYIMEDNLELIGISMCFVVLMFLLTSVTIVSMLLQFVNKHKKEIAVHLLYGSTIFDLFIRLDFPFFIMFVLDYGICELLLREQNVLWPTKLLTGVILVLLPALPLVKMNIEDLYLLLRKETNFD